MNPERAGLSKESGSYGVNVLELPKGQRPKATDVSPWYGVYDAEASDTSFFSSRARKTFSGVMGEVLMRMPTAS